MQIDDPSGQPGAPASTDAAVSTAPAKPVGPAPATFVALEDGKFRRLQEDTEGNVADHPDGFEFDSLDKLVRAYHPNGLAEKLVVAPGSRIRFPR